MLDVSGNLTYILCNKEKIPHFTNEEAINVLNVSFLFINIFDKIKLWFKNSN
jgi:hypothetical protein